MITVIVAVMTLLIGGGLGFVFGCKAGARAAVESQPVFRRAERTLRALYKVIDEGKAVKGGRNKTAPSRRPFYAPKPQRKSRRYE